MADRLSELAESVLDRVYTYGYQQRAAELGQRKAEDELKAAEEALRIALKDRDHWRESRQQQEVAAELMQNQIETLRVDRDHWRESRRQAIEAGELMRDEIETLRQKLERSQQQASDFVQTIDENNDRLTEAEARIWPGKTFGDDAVAMMVSEILDLRKELADAKREASEFVERQVLKAVAAGDSAELERLRLEVVKLRTLNDGLLESSKRLRESSKRLREFADCVRIGFANYEWPEFYAMIKNGLAELDATNPTPVTEPMGGAE